MIGFYPVLILIFFVVYLGIPYLIYLTFRTRLVTHLKGKRDLDPWPIFRVSWWGAFLWFILMMCLSFIPLIGGLFLLLGGLYGGIRLVIDLFRNLFGNTPQKKFWKKNPPPKLQFSMMDIYVGVFVYGCTLTLFAAPGPHQKLDEGAVVAFSVFFLMGQGIAFYVALDVLRRTERLKNAAARSVFIFLLMAYSSFFFILTWMSWRGWRYTMWQLSSDVSNRRNYRNPYLRSLQERVKRTKAVKLKETAGNDKPPPPLGPADPPIPV